MRGLERVQSGPKGEGDRLIRELNLLFSAHPRKMATLQPAREPVELQTKKRRILASTTEDFFI